MTRLDFDEREAVHRRRGRRAAIAALLTLLLLVGGAVGGGYMLIRHVFGGADYPGPGTGRVLVEVQDGQTLTAIGSTLQKRGVIRSVRAFQNAARTESRAQSIQPGVYALRKEMAAAAALDLLLDPASRVQDKVVLREGLTVAETVAALAEATGRRKSEFEAVLDKPAPLGLPAWAKGRAEGFLFPATYTFEPKTATADVLGALVGRFSEAAADTGLDGGATIDGKAYSPLQVLTVASILEKEAPPEAMPEVARVLYNRLAAGMALQLDSTIAYLTGRPGLTTTAAERARKSPYNTYLNPGLPPGPINSPGEGAMRAAREPAAGDWLYFVTVDPHTGDTRFARTFEEHSRNVALFRAWLKAHPGG